MDDQIRFNNATCGRRFFLNTEENTSVFESTWLRVDEAFYCCVVMLCDGVGKLTFLLFNVHFSGWQIIIYFSRRHKLQRLVALLQVFARDQIHTHILVL